MSNQFCNYVLLDELGGGGASVVCRAQTRDGRIVALKMLAPYLLQDKEARARFERQAMLNPPHPNIVPVLEVGECAQAKGPSVPFIVMTYIPGEPLDAMIARIGRLTPAQFLPILREIAAAMDAAHAAGIIHRDIKPANVLMRTDGHAFLSDFGIARAINMAGLTRAGNAFIGTAAYMSPEQAKGLPLTPASDIYSLGALAYQALSGGLPFVADNEVAVARMHVQDPPPALKHAAPQISGAISAVVMRALNKDPRRRYASASLFAESFERAVKGISTSRVVISGISQAAKKSPAAFVIAALALVLALALGAFLLMGNSEGGEAQEPARTSAPAATALPAQTATATVAARPTSTLLPPPSPTIPRPIPPTAPPVSVATPSSVQTAQSFAPTPRP